ncbi:MAG: hypothetical protein IKV06_04185 [Alistipes sp.]|nr:hypothetical protein [Alistipes sp.]
MAEMEYMTKGDFAMWENRRNYGYDCGYPLHKQRNALQGASITAVVLGGVGLAVAVAIGLGVNAASKARSRGNERVIDKLSEFTLRENERRANWENKNTPSTLQYVDVQTGAGAFSNANAAAIAANNPLNAAVGNVGFVRVQRYSSPQPCGCDTCEG